MTDQLLRNARRDHDATLAQMAEWLGTSNQRVHQWENGQPIPTERIVSWAADEALPDWVRQMARELLVAQLRKDYEALGERLTTVAQIIGQ